MTAVEELRAEWERAWPAAREAWSRYTLLHDPTWCLTEEQEAAEGLEDSFAMIRFADHAVVVSLRQVAARGLQRFAREILAHEVGHHVLCPANLADHGRLLARVRAALPGREQLAPLVANLYGDLLINDRLQRQAGLDLAGVYRALGSGSKDALWTLCLRVYEILWSLGRGTLCAGVLTPRLEGDAHLGARLVRVYAREWLEGAGRFAALCLPYLLADGGEGMRRLLRGWQDTKNAGRGGDPGDLTQVEPGEEAGAVHPAADPAISGIDAPLPETATPAAATGGPGVDAGDDGARQRRKRYREPGDYGELLRSAGLEISDGEAVARYYRQRALPHLVPFPRRRQPRAREAQPEGLETWDRGEPLERIDWLQSVIVSPRVVPGVTTVQRTWETSPGEEAERAPLDLLVGIDCSGSMVDPRRAVSFPVLAGCVLALSALRAGAKVMAVLSGHPGPHRATRGFVDDERALLRTLTGFIGTGYAFGIPLLGPVFAERRATDRPAHVVVVSDHDIFAILDQKSGGRSGWEIAAVALAAARGGGTFVLRMPPAWAPERIQQLRGEGWQVASVLEWEHVVAFAREFSRRAWGDGPAQGAS